MNFKNFRAVLMSTILVASALLWLGCQNPSQGPKAAAPAMGAELNDGTTDGGGGNGLNNRPLDSYIINPFELSAYKNHLAHMFESSDEKRTRTLLPRDIFKFKNWYVADVKLKPIEQDRLGLSFTDDFTQQMAIQTSRAIWIDASIFEKMDEKEQAKLILHEFVMNAYFLKFMKYSDICKMYANTSAAQVTCYDSIDELFIPKKEAPLTFNDYENIRGMTAWLWNNWKTATDHDVARELIRYDFDKYSLVSLFKKNDPARDPVNKPIPLTTIAEWVEKAVLLNKAPTECRGLNTQETVGCKLSIEPINIPTPVKGAPDIPGMKFTAKTADGKIVLEERFYTLGNGYLSDLEDVVTGKGLFLVPLATPNLGIAHKGQKYRTNFLILSLISSYEKDPQYELYAIVSVAGVVIKTENEPPVGPLEAFKNLNGLCWGDRPKATSMEDDVIAMVSPGVETAYLRWFGNYIRGMAMPCTNGIAAPAK